jgi:hypothetical protein
VPVIPPSYVARFYYGSTACENTPTVITSQVDGSCFVNPVNAILGFIRFTTVSATLTETILNGGGYSDAACLTTAAPLANIPTGLCVNMPGVPGGLSFRVDLQGSFKKKNQQKKKFNDWYEGVNVPVISTTTVAAATTVAQTTVPVGTVGFKV